MNTITVNKSGKLITRSIQKYIDILKTGLIQEREIISMRSLMNKNKDAAQVIFEFWDGQELSIAEDQALKGYEFLIDQWKTPRGVERKNNPYGYREQEILENFSHFTLTSLYDASRNRQFTNYLPLYRCYSKDGNAFEYYYNGEVNIVG